MTTTPTHRVFSQDELAELGVTFLLSLGMLSMLGHRNGAEVDRYCERPGHEFGDLCLDALLMANITTKGKEARDRVEEWLQANDIPDLVAVMMEGKHVTE